MTNAVGTNDSGRLFLLWDASVVVSYYIPEAVPNDKVTRRASKILDATRRHRLDAVCYIPNIVVAEVLTAFDRERYSKWDKQVEKHYDGMGRHSTIDGTGEHVGGSTTVSTTVPSSISTT